MSNFLERIKIQLSNKKNQIINKLNLGYIQETGDEIDETQSNLINYMESQINSRDKHNIYLINTALSKINSGDFGKCEDCGEFIGEKRLNFMPETTVCIICAEVLEANSKKQKG